MKGRYERVDMEFARGALLSEVIRLVLQEELDVLRETITERGKLINETTEFPVELIRQQAPDVKVICGLPGEDTSLPLLHIAAATNCVQSIQCLLELGWNIDHQSPFTQSTPVLYAALNNHIDSVNCLLEYNCDINKRAEYYNVSDICSDERNISCDNEKPIDTVDEKMKNKVDISTRSEHNKTQINTYDHECIDELRNNPNEPKNCTSSGGVTPLVIGAQNPRIVFELLRRGAKVDTVCEYDRGSMHITALGVAIKAGQPESVKLLLQAGASVHSICEFNHTHTALDMAICCCKYPTDTKYLNNMAILVDLFISYGADPNIISHHKTLLQNLVVADRSVDVLMMSKLHNAGADVEGRCRPEGHTLLSMSVLHGKTEQVQMLLNKNCQVNYRVKLDKSECDQYTKNTPFSPIELSLFLSEKDIDWATSLLIWDPDFFLFLTRQLSIAEMLLVCGAKLPRNMSSKLRQYKKQLRDYHHSDKEAVKTLCDRLDHLLSKTSNCFALEDISAIVIRKALLSKNFFEISIFNLGLPKSLVQRCFTSRLQHVPLPKRTTIF